MIAYNSEMILRSLSESALPENLEKVMSDFVNFVLLVLGCVAHGFKMSVIEKSPIRPALQASLHFLDSELQITLGDHCGADSRQRFLKAPETDVGHGRSPRTYGDRTKRQKNSGREPLLQPVEQPAIWLEKEDHLRAPMSL